jgi:hypothetical protein
MTQPDVDLVVNCYEKNYRQVLTPGFMAGIADAQKFAFTEVTVLVNNVEDRQHASEMAQELIGSGSGVSRVEFVSDHIDGALRACHLNQRHLAKIPYFTNCALVAVSLNGPRWLCYWDADCTVREPMDWITPVTDAMDDDRRIAIGNPNNWHPGLAEREALELRGDIAIGYGFSDQAFLARRSDLAADIYRRVWRSPASWRYPMIETAAIFECRIDAWMRTSARTRATYLPAVYVHPPVGGENYPKTLRFTERARRKAVLTVGALAFRASDHPSCRWIA